MNATMETILHRRSIRSFLEKPIPKPVLEQIVLAGQYAPSAMNRQNWHFTVLQNQEKIQSLAKAIAAELGMGEEYSFYRPAALILVSAPKDSHNGLADCACALENIFLAAWSLDVGSVWINQLKDICDRPAIRASWMSWGFPQITWWAVWRLWGTLKPPLKPNSGRKAPSPGWSNQKIRNAGPAFYQQALF